MCVHASFFSVDVGEEMPRTVCSGLVGSAPLEELQVWPFDSNERMETEKKTKQNNLAGTFNVHVQGNLVQTVHMKCYS